ncbi:MAG TPA: TetR/AcrR family transcriptional regulator [Pseudomonas sp.]|nr:TetR/AcrR family transcriptional regulator [Pseudomonas sp.]
MPLSQSTRKPRASSLARIEAIHAAARALLAEGGVAELSIYAVAERAGIPPSSVYHFFPSVPLLLRSLAGQIHRAFREVLATPIDHAALGGWHDLAGELERRMVDIYITDAAARQLILAQHGLSEVTQADQRHDLELGRLLHGLFDRHFLLPPLPAELDIFALALELADRVYASSVQQHGQITPRWRDEGLRVVVAYLGLYLPPWLGKRPAPLS